MNYLEIVLQGYFNKNNKEFLDKYFFSEYKKAEIYEADQFFNGCLKVIQQWEDYLQKEVHNRKKELSFMLRDAKNKKSIPYNSTKNKTVDQIKKETIIYCQEELRTISCSDFFIHLSSLTNGLINYNMPYYQALELKEEITKAFEKAKQIDKIKRKLNNTTTQPKELEIEQPLTNENPTKKIITEHYKSISKNEGWNFVFQNEQNYNSFIDLLTRHFEYKEYELPKNVTKLKINKKTIFAKMLRLIHKDLSNESSLRNDMKYFEIIKTLSHFKSLTDNEIYKALTR